MAYLQRRGISPDVIRRAIQIGILYESRYYNPQSEYHTFIGKYAPPHFGEVHLTVEEQEELRRQEEHREIRHQVYLKRKASRVQQRYDAKVRAKKKAEMDAKKNALRAEDMANTVFIPVNQLPKQEPKKAV